MTGFIKTPAVAMMCGTVLLLGGVSWGQGLITLGLGLHIAEQVK